MKEKRGMGTILNSIENILIKMSQHFIDESNRMEEIKKSDWYNNRCTEETDCKTLDVKVQCSACGADIFQENYYSNKTCGECGNIAGAWMHKEPGWKTLDVNDLSDCPDILENGKWSLKSSRGSICSEYASSEFKTRLILEAIENCYEIYYRKTPTEKTDEELAEEWAKKVDRTSSRVFSFEEIVSLREGFIAGRKSKDGEG